MVMCDVRRSVLLHRGSVGFSLAPARPGPSPGAHPSPRPAVYHVHLAPLLQPRPRPRLPLVTFPLRRSQPTAQRAHTALQRRHAGRRRP